MVFENRYETKQVIHKGQMSSVYIGMDHLTGKMVIVKCAQNTKNGVAENSLRKEIEILSKINHKDIPKLQGIYNQENKLIVVMEKKEGKTLCQLLKEGFHPNIREIQKIGLQLCEILLYLHNQERPIIHRDIKTENILYKERISLIDFGAAREYNRSTSQDTVCLGTVGFAAPEQFGGNGQSDERTDIYGLGKTLKKLLEASNQKNYKLSRLVERCTKKNPEGRYQCIEEVMAALYGLGRWFGVPKKIVAVTLVHTDVRLYGMKEK